MKALNEYILMVVVHIVAEQSSCFWDFYVSFEQKGYDNL